MENLVLLDTRNVLRATRLLSLRGRLDYAEIVTDTLIIHPFNFEDLVIKLSIGTNDSISNSL